MLHEPASQSGKDAAAPYKSRLGVWLFFLYALFYVGFVAINLYDPLLMEWIVVFGLNLATVYGFLLIIGALILALVYNNMCGKKEQLMDDESNKDGGK
jgi:TRAP-type C4-dicarboxylate transport system permease small subunit